MTSEPTQVRAMAARSSVPVRMLGVALLSAAGLAGCAADPTEVVVVVESDFRVPGDADTVEFRFGDDAVAEANPKASVDLTQTPFPLSWVVTSDGASDSVAVVITALRDGEATMNHTALVSFSTEHTVTRRLTLARVCIAIPCDPGETCRESDLGTPMCASIFDDGLAAADEFEAEGASQ